MSERVNEYAPPCRSCSTLFHRIVCVSQSTSFLLLGGLETTLTNLLAYLLTCILQQQILAEYFD